MREFRKTTGRGKKDQVWFIGKKDQETYFVRWGVLSGVLQETFDRPGSCGVNGHIDYQTPNEYVNFCIEREIRKKLEQGYIEYINGKPVKEVSDSIDFNKQLPKNLCFYKPQLKIEEDKLKKLYDKSRAIWTLKRDGMCHVAVKRNNNWEIYSRRMDLVNKFPHIINDLNKLKVNNGTILLGEMVFTNPDGTDNFKNVSKICRSKDDLALAYQGLGKFPKNKEGVLGKLSFYVFDVPFYNGEDLVSNKNVKYRLNLLDTIIGDLENISKIKTYDIDYLNDLNLAKEMNVEGWVVLDSNAVYGDKGYSFDGKASRPNGIWKRKSKLEDEFIIAGIYTGSGKNRNRFGGFFIEQIHPATGEKINCGKCGGGFTDEHRNSFNESLIGQTIKIEFDSRQAPKDGEYALRFPIFKSFSDKSPEECVAQHI